ncbi:hypothetical protein ABZT49_29235 [Methylobacterium sp. EM32]|uniref:FitA-like ribbon-helix-helix domain-containing protein n=1 Tax=Methylobacterium sp. EM32 TaxID=3163481 RepID=UPI0033A298E1
MRDLTIRNVDDETVEQIASLAQRHGHSVEHEVLMLLREALSTTAARPRSRAEAARQIAALAPRGVNQTDSALLVREDRDR